MRESEVEVNEPSRETRWKMEQIGFVITAIRSHDFSDANLTVIEVKDAIKTYQGCANIPVETVTEALNLLGYETEFRVLH